MELRTRIPEPELMDTAEQAGAYAAADFSEPHDALVGLFGECFPDFVAGRVLDLGCGPGDVTARFAHAYPLAHVDGVDGAAEMLACGKARIAAEGLAARVSFSRLRLPAAAGEWSGRGTYDAVLATSLLHHLADASVLWATIAAAARPGAAVFVWELRRPATTEAARALVQRYAGNEPEVLRTDFYNSLCAAYTAAEVRAQMGATDLGLEVVEVGDRHLVVHGRR